MMNRFSPGLARMITILALSSITLCAAQTQDVIIDRNAPARMRDGTVLRADIYRPKAPGKFPVLLERTPYNKDGVRDLGIRAARRGYVVVIQDVRGRYASEGVWYPFKYESLDGYDTVEWAAALPGSDGRVAMMGGSYVGATQLLAAIAQPPHLVAIAPLVTAANYHDGWVYDSGAFEQWFNESWTSGLAQNTLERLVRKKMSLLQWRWVLPVSRYPVLDLGRKQDLAPYFDDWLRHPSYDAYWKRWSIAAHYNKIKVPALNLGGWYDVFLGGTLQNYTGMKAHAGSAKARRNQWLVIGPWYHGSTGSQTGKLNFGPQASVNRDEVMLRWCDYILKGAHNEFDRGKHIKIFVMGKNKWRYEDDWPPPRARDTRFYLHSGGKANSLAGDGTLSTKRPSTEAADHYVYDPADPVPTRGGWLCCAQKVLIPGVFDQRPVEKRDDVLVYTTNALPAGFEITGPVNVELSAGSSAVDTDFTARLVDVYPNGFAQNLSDGILRARYRDSPEHADFMVPGRVYQFRINLLGTSDVLLKGHELRLEISSSNFPRFDRNLNTGGETGFQSRFVKARNTIYHDARRPSYMVMPVVAR